MPFCISPQIIFDAVINDGLSIAYYNLSIFLRSTVADRLNTCLWLVRVLFWTWRDTVATQRLIKLKEKIDFDYLVRSQPLIKLTDQIGFSFSPSIHDLLSLSLCLSLDHPHQFHVLVLKNCSVPVLCPCFFVFCHFFFEG